MPGSPINKGVLRGLGKISMNDVDLTAISASELARAVGAREVTARQVAEAMLARIALLNPVLNAVCTMNDAALAEADAIDARLAAGGEVRALEGVPFVVKDNIVTRGIRTTFGSKLMAEHIPDEDAISVERMRAAGAVLLGKTNTPEFAHDVNTTNLVFGTTRNPWDVNRTAGGSSGGTAAAIAAGFAPVGLGTDLGGSIRFPASFNGVFGIRPVPGRVPFYPVEFAWDTLVQHVQGPLARSVEDLGLVLSVLAGPDDRDPTSLPAPAIDLYGAARAGCDLSGARIAMSVDLGGILPVAPAVEAAVRAAADGFTSLGCVVEEDCFDTQDLAAIIRGTRSFGMIARYLDRYEAHAADMTGALINQIKGAMEVDLREVAQAERLRTDYWHRVRTFFTHYDFIITPTIGDTAFRLDEPLPEHVGEKAVKRYYDIFLAGYAFSVTGLPAMSLPCGFDENGLPIGMQLVGPRLREDRVLAAAATFARAHPQHIKRAPADIGTVRPVADDFSSPGLVMPGRVMK
ncbi:MAG: amidase [Gammaproteobacteria bacterium]|jgi:amidase